MLSLEIVLTLLSATTWPALTMHKSYPQPRPSFSPCDDLAKTQSVYLAENPSRKIANVTAKFLYDCLTNVPVQKSFSIRLVDNVRAWFEFQSQVDYIRSPPSGWFWQPFDQFVWRETPRMLRTRTRLVKNSYP